METNTKPDKKTLERWKQDSNNWKLGMFYYNKEDKRIFPPKRNEGLGWTLNFANASAYAFLAINIILGLAIVVISQYIKSH